MKNQEHEQLLNEAKQLSDAIREIEAVDVDKQWLATLDKRQRRSRRLHLNQLTRIAAMLTLPLLITSLTLGWLYFRPQTSEVQYAEVRSANGVITRYELPDHSVVWLNSGTTLRYSTLFADAHRSVELDGEAYFEVQADRKRPFYVHTSDDVKVYVYGTKFNVTAYRSENIIETVLEKGRVNVQAANQQEFVMQPGDHISYDKVSGRWTMEKVDVDEKLAWKEGKMVFRNASLDEIFRRLSRHFNVEIAYEKHGEKDYRFRATFCNETLPQILDYLSQSVRMKWSYVDKGTSTDSKVRQQIVIHSY